MSVVETYPSEVAVEPLSDSEIVCWNLEFLDLTPTERIERAYQRLGGHLVAASSVGRTAALSLKAVSEAEPDIPVAVVRHHHETLETLRLIDWYAEEFDLNLQLYDAPVRPIPLPGSRAFAEFQQEVKVEPFQHVLEDHQALGYISGRMHWQLPGRAALPFVERKGAVLAINAVVDIDRQTAEDVFEVTGWPRDPHYFDPTKGPDQKLECGLNTTNYDISREEEQ